MIMTIFCNWFETQCYDWPLTSPEGVNTLSLEDPHGTVNHAIVRLVKTSLLDHLVLILNKQLDSLNGGSWKQNIMIFTAVIQQYC